MLLHVAEVQNTPSLQISANGRELVFPMRTAQQRRVRHWDIRKGLLGLARRLAAAALIASQVSDASACAENGGCDGDMWSGGKSHGLQRHVLGGEPPVNQASGRAAG